MSDTNVVTQSAIPVTRHSIFVSLLNPDRLIIYGCMYITSMNSVFITSITPVLNTIAFKTNELLTNNPLSVCFCPGCTHPCIMQSLTKNDWPQSIPLSYIADENSLTGAMINQNVCRMRHRGQLQVPVTQSTTKLK